MLKAFESKSALNETLGNFSSGWTGGEMAKFVSWNVLRVIELITAIRDLPILPRGE